MVADLWTFCWSAWLLLLSFLGFFTSMFFTEFYSVVYPLESKEELPYLNVYIPMWLSYRSITNAKFYRIVYPTLDFMTKFWLYQQFSTGSPLLCQNGPSWCRWTIFLSAAYKITSSFTRTAFFTFFFVCHIFFNALDFKVCGEYVGMVCEEPIPFGGILTVSNFCIHPLKDHV